MSRLERRICSLALAGGLALAGCDASNPADFGENPEPTPLFSTAPNAMRLKVGDTAVIMPATRESNSKPFNARSLKWKTTNTEAATVGPDGKVFGLSEGETLIIASNSSQSDTTAVVVEAADEPSDTPAGQRFAISPDWMALSSIGESAQLTITLDAPGTSPDATVTWTSLNPDIAQVDGMGKVTARAYGTAIIVAASACCSNSDSATVKVAQTQTQIPALPGATAELPQVWVSTDWVQPTGKTISVAQGGDLQAAINSAQRGDVVELQGGATFTGNFTLPAKSGSGWIVIRSNGSLPPLGTRVTPAQAGSLAKLVSTRGAGDRVLTAATGASHYRIVGLEIAYATSVSAAGAVVDMQRGSSHIILERSYVHGHSNLDLQRCVVMHAEHAAVIDSWLSDCHYKGADSQAIVAWNTNGPLKIVNNYLEGAGENVMLGGSTPAANTLPSDVEIRRNYFYKPQSWRLADGTSRWTVKNLFEIKFGRRILLEGNIFDGNWTDGQDGHAFNIKLSAYGSGDRTEDITIRYNILRNSEKGMKIGSSVTRAHVHDNLIYDIDSRLFTLLGADDLRIENNTGIHGGNIITSTGGHERFVARGNVWGAGDGYGVKGSAGEGTATLDADFPGWVYEQNGHIARAASRYPEGNRFVANAADVRFANVATGDLRLGSNSPFAGLGADVAHVLSLTAGVK